MGGREYIKKLSDRIVAAQRPIRILTPRLKARAESTMDPARAESKPVRRPGRGGRRLSAGTPSAAKSRRKGA